MVVVLRLLLEVGGEVGGLDLLLGGGHAAALAGEAELAELLGVLLVVLRDLPDLALELRVRAARLPGAQLRAARDSGGGLLIVLGGVPGEGGGVGVLLLLLLAAALRLFLRTVGRQQLRVLGGVRQALRLDHLDQARLALPARVPLSLLARVLGAALLLQGERVRAEVVLLRLFLLVLLPQHRVHSGDQLQVLRVLEV